MVFNGVLQNCAVQQVAGKYSAPYKETGSAFDKLRIHRVLDHAKLSFAVFLEETCQRCVVFQAVMKEEVTVSRWLTKAAYRFVLEPSVYV